MTESDKKLLAAIPGSTLDRYREHCAGEEWTGMDVRDKALFALHGRLPTLYWEDGVARPRAFPHGRVCDKDAVLCLPDSEPVIAAHTLYSRRDNAVVTATIVPEGARHA